MVIDMQQRLYIVTRDMKQHLSTRDASSWTMELIPTIGIVRKI